MMLVLNYNMLSENRITLNMTLHLFPIHCESDYKQQQQQNTSMEDRAVSKNVLKKSFKNQIKPFCQAMQVECHLLHNLRIMYRYAQ